MGVFLNRGINEFDRAVNSKIYVDKSDMITFFNDIIGTEQAYACVSRPRRFGKSIAANMLAAYFEKGSDARYLFENRKLGKTPNWDKNLNKYDVIRIDVAGLIAEMGSADKALDYIDVNLIKDLKTAYPNSVIDEKYGIASALCQVNLEIGAQFVIIIDEWDAIFRDDKNNTEVQERYINLLRSLFKDNRAKNFTALAYITGILPIKKYNSESALNNFYEYTMLNPKKLAQYIGFTEDEVKALCEEYDMDFEEAKQWYDGYCFKGAKHIYGPNSVVRAMFDGEYDNYWSQTVAYNSLAGYISMNFDGLKDAIVSMLSGQRVRIKVRTYENDMVNFKSKDDVLTLLIHLGYIAYDEVKCEGYIPNKEVRMCFEDTLEATDWTDIVKQIEDSEKLLDRTIRKDADYVANAIDDCHMLNTSILKYNDENSLACCIALAYYYARNEYTIVRELPSGYGFADMVFIPKENVNKPAMIVELKWKKDEETALTQIKDKKYVKGLEGYKGEVLLVGINYEKDGDNSKKHSCVIESTVL